MNHRRCALLAAALAAVCVSAHAAMPTQTDLYDFTSKGAGGTYASTGLIADRNGNFYGATGLDGTYGRGAVFSYSGSGQFTVLHAFTGQNCDTAASLSPLSRDSAGNLYGPLFDAGDTCANGGIWRVAPDGTFTVLHEFAGGTDGANATGPLVFDARGNGYGAAQTGGSGSGQGDGLIYRIAPDGTESVFYTFSGLDGANPVGLALDNTGNLIGATVGGGAAGYGTLFRIDLTTGSETVLYSFDNTDAGVYPVGPPAEDSLGNIYGVNYAGGAKLTSRQAVFRLAANGTAALVLEQSKSKGVYLQPELTIDQGNNVFAVFQEGATLGAHPYGAIYRISAAGHSKLYYAFVSGKESVFPDSPLVLGHDGALYGTTEEGGTGKNGAIFKLSR